MSNYTYQDFIGAQGLKVRFDYDGGTLPIYIGYAMPGTATSALGWRIVKITYDGSENITAIDFAESSNGFAFEYDERTSYTYG